MIKYSKEGIEFVLEVLFLLKVLLYYRFGDFLSECSVEHPLDSSFAARKFQLFENIY